MTDTPPPQTTEAPEYNIGPLDSFPERKVVPAFAGDRRIGVLRKGDQMFAFADRCPHHGAPMCFATVSGTMQPSAPNEFHYDLDGLVVKCPWHAYEFDVRTGQAMGGIIRSRLMIFQTSIRDGDVFVRLKRIAVAEAGSA